MKKLIQGIVEFRKNVRADYKETFAKLALGQKPDTLMIACSDSRVVPNLFASADPGDLFVVRNVGNLVAPCGADGLSVGDESEPAAIEFAVSVLGVSDIILCGHSECGAVRAVLEGVEKVNPPHLHSWLKHGQPSLNSFEKEPLSFPRKLERWNQLSQTNVLQQLQHLQTYKLVRDRMKAGALRLHGWWFDIAQAEVYFYEHERGQFSLIDESKASQLLKTLL